MGGVARGRGVIVDRDIRRVAQRQLLQHAVGIRELGEVQRQLGRVDLEGGVMIPQGGDASRIGAGVI